VCGRHACPYAWKLLAAPTSLILVGRHCALGRTLGPARAAGNGKEETQAWGSICLHLQAGKSWEDSRADLKKRKTPREVK